MDLPKVGGSPGVLAHHHGAGGTARDQRRALRGQRPTVNTIDVADIDATLKTVTGKGGKICMPKFAMASVGHVAYCEDPEGNMFGVLQADASAR